MIEVGKDRLTYRRVRTSRGSIPPQRIIGRKPKINCLRNARALRYVTDRMRGKPRQQLRATARRRVKEFSEGELLQL